MMKNSIENEFAKIIKEYQQTMFEAVEEALDDVSLDMQRKLEQASPVGEGPIHFKNTWDRKMHYKGVRYIGNTKRVPNDQGIPLSNILEHGKNGKPFIKRTFNMNKEEIYQKFIKKLGGKI